MIILTGGLGAWNLVTEYSNLGTGQVGKSFNTHKGILANVKRKSKPEKAFEARKFGMYQS